MGVADPGLAGQGIGSLLMVRNKRLYERHGFEVEDPFGAADGPPLWPMWRQPASDR
jgi:hypothetical protein